MAGEVSFDEGATWVLEQEMRGRRMDRQKPTQPEPAAVVRSYFQRLLNKKDLAVIREALAEDYVDHDAPPETPLGPAEAERWTVYQD